MLLASPPGELAFGRNKDVSRTAASSGARKEATESDVAVAKPIIANVGLLRNHDL
jgi:hypothetical protein